MTIAPAPTGHDGASALWAEFVAPVRAFVRRRAPTGVEVEDVVQEIFLRVLRHLPATATVERLDAWIFRIARTALIDAQRANRRHAGRASDVEPDGLASRDGTDDLAAIRELAPCLIPFVAQLDEPYRSALRLTSLQGLTQQEAAQQAGISVSGMKSRVQRAREKLRAMMLRCCDLELDTRGAVTDYSVRDPSVCGAVPANAAGGRGPAPCAAPDGPTGAGSGPGLRPI